MNTKRKVASLALGVCLALSVCACGSPAQSGGSGQEAAATSATTHLAKYKTKVTKAPTCYEPGEHVRYCKICEDNGLSEHPDKVKVEPTRGHSMTLKKVETKVTVKPTCTEGAYSDFEYYCPDCGELIAVEHHIMTQKPLGHKFNYADPETGETFCSACGVRGVRSGGLTEAEDEGSWCSHNFTDSQTIKEPGCLTAGIECQTCTQCGEKQYIALTPTGHHYDDTECLNCGMPIDGISQESGEPVDTAQLM